MARLYTKPCSLTWAEARRAWGAADFLGARLRWESAVHNPRAARGAAKWGTPAGHAHVQAFKYLLLGTTAKPTIDILPWDVFTALLQKKQ